MHSRPCASIDHDPFSRDLVPDIELRPAVLKQRCHVCTATADFDVVEVLGSGSFSTVFKIHSKGPDQGVYVLKETRQLSTSETTQAHVAREVEMLLLSRGCPGIVQYHASFVEQDNHYTVRPTLPPIAVRRYIPVVR